MFLQVWLIKLCFKCSTALLMYSPKVHIPSQAACQACYRNMQLSSTKFSLSHFCIVKRHHDQDNSSKGKHLIGFSLQIRRSSILSDGKKPGSMHGTWEVARVKFWYTGPKRNTELDVGFWNLKTHLSSTVSWTRPHILILLILSNSSTYWWLSIQT